MSEQYFYSASRGGFYALSMKFDYDTSPLGWPDDAVEVPGDDYVALMEGQGVGKVIAAGPSGLPVLLDHPNHTEQEIVMQNEIDKSSRLSMAESAIKPYQYASDIGQASEYEKQMLNMWKSYYLEVSRTPTDSPVLIEWPANPE